MCPFGCVKAAGFVSQGYIVIWKSKMAPTLNDGRHYACKTCKMIWSLKRIQLAYLNGLGDIMHVLKVIVIKVYGSNFFKVLLGSVVLSRVAFRPSFRMGHG